MASGSVQSHVVALRTDDVREIEEVYPLQVDYELFMCRILKKTQVGWKVVPGKGQIHLSNGPLDSSYILYEIHGHIVGDPGLESCRRHSVNGKKYAGELHLLHYDPLMSHSPNKKYNPQPDNKVIICLLLEEGNVNNELSKIAQGLDNLILNEVQTIELEDDVDPTFLLPEGLAYWMYKEVEERLGENKKETTWIILKRPIEASEGQIAAMRSPHGQASAAVGIPPPSEKIISEGIAVLVVNSSDSSDSKCCKKRCSCC